MLALAAVLIPGVALADQPLNLPEPVTDLTSAQVLQDGRDEIDAALTSLQDNSDYQLWVVFADTFDDIDPEEWANQTADLSDLGSDDVLLAVATEARRFTLNASDAVAQDDFDRAYDALEPALADAASGEGTWANVVVASAEALEGGSGGFSLLIVVIVIAVIVLVVFLVVRGRRKSGGGAANPGQAPTEELVNQSGSALVAIDDELRSFEQDLGFAEAQFGSDATGQARTTLAEAKATVQQAFAWRSQLDSETSEDPRRQLATRILQACHAAHEAMSQQSEAIEKLRQEQTNVPERLGRLEERTTEVSNRLGPARQTISTLMMQYPAGALTTVSSNPEHAAALIDAARGAIATGRQHVAAGDLAAAVSQAQVAENALGQAAEQLDGVERAASDLAQANTKLAQATGSINADIADAARLAPDDGAVDDLVDRARAAIALAGAAKEPDGDPLAALAALSDAEAALDGALAPYREAADVANRARAQVAERAARLESVIRSTNSYIDSRRGAVGPQARTDLAEAIRLLGEANRLAGSEPQRALALLQQAEQRAGSASQLAQRDVAQWDSQQRGRSGGGVDLDSLLLGGVLFGNRGRRGGYSWGSGGSWGGGSSWGGSSRGGRSSRSGRSSRGSSFGGGRSRSSSRGSSRRSRGGRF